MVFVLCLGFLRGVEKCLTDSSWFVKKAAVDLVSELLCNPDTSAVTAFDVALSEEERNIVAVLFAPVITDVTCDTDKLTVCLDVLEKLDLSISLLSFLNLDTVQVLAQRLCITLRHLPISTGMSCTTELRILAIIDSLCESCGDDDNDTDAVKHEMLQLIVTMLNEGRVLSVVAVAVWLLKRFEPL